MLSCIATVFAELKNIGAPEKKGTKALAKDVGIINKSSQQNVKDYLQNSYLGGMAALQRLTTCIY